MSDTDDRPRLDRSAFSVGSIDGPSNERDYWQGRLPEERLAAVFFLREIVYGRDAATARLQRVLEIAQLGEG